MATGLMPVAICFELTVVAPLRRRPVIGNGFPVLDRTIFLERQWRKLIANAIGSGTAVLLVLC